MWSRINFKDMKLSHLLEVTDRLIPVSIFKEREKERSAVVQSIMKASLSESDALWYHWLRCVQLWYYPPTLSRSTNNWPQCRSCQTDGSRTSDERIDLWSIDTKSWYQRHVLSTQTSFLVLKYLHFLSCVYREQLKINVSCLASYFVVIKKQISFLTRRNNRCF